MTQKIYVLAVPMIMLLKVLKYFIVATFFYLLACGNEITNWKKWVCLFHGQVDSPELPETPEITEMTENFTKVTKYLAKFEETLINYVWEKSHVYRCYIWWFGACRTPTQMKKIELVNVTEVWKLHSSPFALQFFWQRLIKNILDVKQFYL